MSAVMKIAPSDDLYAQLEALPENLTGEIIDGQLYAESSSTGPQLLARSALGMEIFGLYHKGREGPGGW